MAKPGIALAILEKYGPKKKADEPADDTDDGMLGVMEAFIDAVKSGDARKAVAEMSAFHEMCGASPAKKSGCAADDEEIPPEEDE